MRQGGYFPGKVTRVVDKFSNAWVKFPNEKKEIWWSVEVLLQWMPAGAAFAAMPAAFAAIATADAAAKATAVTAAEPTAVVTTAEPAVTATTTEPAAKADYDILDWAEDGTALLESEQGMSSPVW